MKTPFAVSTALVLFLMASHSGRAEDLMQNGGFELPVVKTRTPKEAEGDPVNGGIKSLWQIFNVTPSTDDGKVTAGLTNEIAHTGSQSFFVKFDNVPRSYQNAVLQTVPIAVVPGSPYAFKLWGRVDKKNPLTLGDRPAYLKIQIEFFAEDGTTPAGDPEYRIQPIPGSKNRDPIFTADKWNEFSTDITTPVDAAFMVLNLMFETGSAPGKTNGLIYFDDLSISGEFSNRKLPKPKPEETEEPAPVAEPTPAAATTPAAASTPAAK
ncbi:MAG: hypothetical protein WCH43_09295 [Verrucomicrobiota bacterium]